MSIGVPANSLRGSPCSSTSSWAPMAPLRPSTPPPWPSAWPASISAKLTALYVVDPYPYLGVGETNPMGFQAYMAAAQQHAAQAHAKVEALCKRTEPPVDLEVRLVEDVTAMRGIVDMAQEEPRRPGGRRLARPHRHQPADAGERGGPGGGPLAGAGAGGALSATARIRDDRSIRWTTPPLPADQPRKWWLRALFMLLMALAFHLAAWPCSCARRWCNWCCCCQPASRNDRLRVFRRARRPLPRADRGLRELRHARKRRSRSATGPRRLRL